MTRIYRRRFAPLLAACLVSMGVLGAPAAAMQILEAADHAEVAAEISATGINRIALAGDRIAKVVRAPDGFAVEHDARSGDLYLRPLTAGAAGHDPVTLFVGTEKGFTYRLTLTLSDRDSAQILIRNARAFGGTAAARPAAADTHIAALTRLVRAVARREPMPGHDIVVGGKPPAGGLSLIETWRGPRFAALVFEAARPASEGADVSEGLAGTIGETLAAGRVAALWLAAPGTGPSGGRLAVAVVETGTAGDRR